MSDGRPDDKMGIMPGQQKEGMCIVVLVLCITVLHFLPWITRIGSHSDDRVFLAIHNSRSDYPVYLDYIKQGLGGNWQVRNSFAIEPHDGTYFYWMFLLMGQIGRVVGTDDAQFIYHAATFFFGAVWFIVLYGLCRSVFRDWKLRVFAFGIFIFSTSFPILYKADGGWISQWYMSWWTELDPIHRAYFLPHHAAGHTLVVGIVLLVLHAVDRRQIRYILGAIPLGLIAGVIHPPSLIIVLLSMPAYILVRRRFRLLPAVGIFCIVSSMSLLFIQNELKRFPIEGSYESLSFAVSMKEYLLALGPIVPLAVVGVFALRKKPALLIFFFWAVFSIAAVDIARRLLTVPWPLLRAIPISNVRFLQHAVWIPLGVLAVSGFEIIRKKFGKPASAFVVLVFCILTAVGYPNGFTAYSATLPVVNDYDAPTKEWGDAIGALGELPQGRVFAMQFTSFYIPGLTGRGVYAGREYITLKHSEKAANAYQFFRGMDECIAYTLLTTSGFTGVFYGFDEQKAGEAVWSYSFLDVVKRFGNTVVFRVIEQQTPDCIP